MEAKELEKMFNVTSEELTQWEADASNGVLHGRPTGKVVFGPGRPSMFSEGTKQIGFREPLTKANMITLRAKNLGLRRSDYLRRLVDEDLVKAGLI